MFHKVLFFAWVGLMFCFSCSQKKPVLQNYEAKNTPVNLSEHSKEFKKEVIKITDGVYMAVGYGLANSILLEGKDSLVIVDVMESVEAAQGIKKEFDKITQKPIAALIYTHNHTDHTFGAKGFTGNQKVEVYAHESTNFYLDQVLSIVRPILQKRSYRMFGNYLNESELINAGIGPHLHIDENTTLGLLRPTRTFTKKIRTKIAGIDIELIHAPGETNDQIYVWLPEKKVLMCGDNLYRTFPNLYTIRGTPHRDLMQWVRSLDIIRYLQPEYLAPSHTRPILGKVKIREIVTTYRDGIQYVHDQTVRWMNRGMTPDELVQQVRLPEHLAKSPFLQEFYGKVSWSVRNVFNGYLGFFDGNPATLQPLPPIEKARKMVQLAGGEAALEKNCLDALAQKEYQWALELSDYLLRIKPDNQKVKEARIAALTKLGEAESNPNARHYYLTSAKELAGLQEMVTKVTAETVHDFPLSAIFASLAVNLDPAKSIQTNKKVLFYFPDVKENYSIHVRRGVAEVQAFAMENPDMTITVDSKTWKEIVAKIRNSTWAYTIGKLKIEGGASEFAAFMKMFQAE